MQFFIYDNIPESIAICSVGGEILYGNIAFANLVNSSQTRLVNKTPAIESLIQGIWPENFKPQEFENSSITLLKKFTTNDGTSGTAQVLTSVFIENHEHLVFLYIRDYSLEEKLQKKYKLEEQHKQKKIEELKILINLLGSTRLVKEPFLLAREFIHHTVNHYKIPFCIFKERLGPIQWFSNLSSPNDDNIFSAWSFLNATESDPSLFQNKDWLYTPLKPRGDNYLDILFPLNFKDCDLNFEIIKTLSEHTSMIIENANLEKMATHDELTKLKNSRLFRDVLQSYSNQYDLLHLALLDIDHFKKVNDTYGHPAGDQVLKTIAKTLRRFEVGENICARVGGEEFAILLPRQTTEQALVTLENIRITIEQLQIIYEEKSIPVTSSFGLSVWDKKAETDIQLSDFYKRADLALYDSKKSGRNRITLFKIKADD